MIKCSSCRSVMPRSLVQTDACAPFHKLMQMVKNLCLLTLVGHNHNCNVVARNVKSNAKAVVSFVGSGRR